MTGRHRTAKQRGRRFVVRLLAGVGWGYTGRHRLTQGRPRWTTPPGMFAPVAPALAPVHAGPALPTSRQSLAPRLSVVTVGLVAPERADEAVYARVDAERDAAATAQLAQAGDVPATRARHVA